MAGREIDPQAQLARSTTGRRLGRYHLSEPLGGGPCGEVYRAKVYGVAGFERQFAVKRFHPELVATPVVPQKLSSAARAYGSLEHPRIARLHEYGVAGGEVFTATEMVAGLDVMRLIAATHGSGAPLPPGAALALATQAARAIGYAHGRGLAHLGICPTNVIVTPDGDVKITDFGMLAQTLTVRASDDPRLVHRIHHLSPEQLVGEAASAASDVFALGALIHELVTGERAFVGVTPLDVEHAILSGHVREAGLPKAMGRVMARCFARSPYERFPDARALADAIDAALRVTPVQGGRRELGVLVKEAVARLDAMNEGQLSGAMMLAMPMPPSTRTPAPRPRVSTRGSDQVTALREPTMQGPPPTPPGPPSRPPIPARPQLGSAPPARPTLPAWGMPAGGAAAHAPPTRSASPTRPPPITPPALVPRIRPTQPPPLVVQARGDEDSEERTLSRDPAAPHLSPSGPVPPPPSRVPNASPLPFATPPPELLPSADPPPLPGRPGVLRLDSAWPTGENSSIPDGSEPLDGGMRPSEPMIEMRIDDDSEGVPVLPPMSAARTSSPSFHAPPLPAPELTPPPVLLHHDRAPAPAPAPKKRSGALWMVVFLIVCSGLGVGAVFAWQKWMRDDGAPETTAASAREPEVKPDKPPADKKPNEVKTPVTDVRVADVDAGTAAVTIVTIDAGAEIAAEQPDAGAGAGVGTGQEIVPPPEDPTPAPTGDLRLDSEPHGTVYIDGEKVGKTPHKHDAYPGTHVVVIAASGRELYIAKDLVLAGKHEIELPKVKKTDGDAGLKVKCRKKNRYYVFVDGAPTGELCPTDEIKLPPGDHLVELYDLETNEKKPYPVKLEKSRNSFKLVIE